MQLQFTNDKKRFCIFLKKNKRCVFSHLLNKLIPEPREFSDCFLGKTHIAYLILKSNKIKFYIFSTKESNRWASK